MDFLEYRFWPAAKVRLVYWWWILKYGGKKRIPPELVFSRMRESMERMNENLMQALRHLPPDAAPKEKQELFDLLRTAANLEEKTSRLRKP